MSVPREHLFGGFVLHRTTRKSSTNPPRATSARSPSCSLAQSGNTPFTFNTTINTPIKLSPAMNPDAIGVT